MPDHKFPIELEHRLWGRMSTVALADPTPKMLRRMLEATDEGQLRGVAHGDLVLIFPAVDMNHQAVRDALNLPMSHREDGGCDFWVIKDGDEPNVVDWETFDDDPVRDGLRLLINSHNEPPCLDRLKSWFAETPRSVPKP